MTSRAVARNVDEHAVARLGRAHAEPLVLAGTDDDADHPETDGKPAYHAHVDALYAAGFAEVGTVWQHGDDRVLVALKG